MVNAKVVGMDKWIARLTAMKLGLRREIMMKGLMVTAEKTKSALEAAAPVGNYPEGRAARKGKKQAKYGPLRSRMIIYERKGSDVWSQRDRDNIIELMIGPSHLAFYGYFQEKGWIPHKKTSKIRRVRLGTGERKTVHIGGGGASARTLLAQRRTRNDVRSICQCRDRSSKESYRRQLNGRRK